MKKKQKKKKRKIRLILFYFISKIYLLFNSQNSKTI
jgi:hypothetical protein